MEVCIWLLRLALESRILRPRLGNREIYYVDKTELIYELVHDTNNKVTLFTRPRRFGKTLMMSMMENFFSIRKDSKSLFDNLDISKHKTFCKEWMNQYPVLFVSFKDVEAEDFGGAYEMLKTVIADVCKGISDRFGKWRSSKSV